MVHYAIPNRVNSARQNRTNRRNAERAYRKALRREGKALVRGAEPMPVDGVPVHYGRRSKGVSRDLYEKEGLK